MTTLTQMFLDVLKTEKLRKIKRSFDVEHIADFQYEKGCEVHKNWKFRRQNRRIQNKSAVKGSFAFVLQIHFPKHKLLDFFF